MFQLSFVHYADGPSEMKTTKDIHGVMAKIDVLDHNHTIRLGHQVEGAVIIPFSAIMYVVGGMRGTSHLPG